MPQSSICVADLKLIYKCVSLNKYTKRKTKGWFRYYFANKICGMTEIFWNQRREKNISFPT